MPYKSLVSLKGGVNGCTRVIRRSASVMKVSMAYAYQDV